MTIRTTLTTTAFAATGLAGATLLALAAPMAASAHVGVTPSSTAAGSYAVMSFAVPHGCEGSPTTVVEIELPESIVSVTPTVNANWTVEKNIVELDEPLTDAHGNEITERTGSVTYTAITPLEDGYRDVLDLQVKLPEDAAGETLAFPVQQTCAEGSTAWDQLAEEGADEPEHPAPVITVTEAEAGDGHGAATTDDGDAHADGEHADSDEASASTDGDADTLARVLGIGGLVVGAVGVVIAIAARRGAAKR